MEKRTIEDDVHASGVLLDLEHAQVYDRPIQPWLVFNSPFYVSKHTSMDSWVLWGGRTGQALAITSSKTGAFKLKEIWEMRVAEYHMTGVWRTEGLKP